MRSKPPAAQRGDIYDYSSLVQFMGNLIIHLRACPAVKNANQVGPPWCDLRFGTLWSINFWVGVLAPNLCWTLLQHHVIQKCTSLFLNHRVSSNVAVNPGLCPKKMLPKRFQKVVYQNQKAGFVLDAVIWNTTVGPRVCSTGCLSNHSTSCVSGCCVSFCCSWSGSESPERMGQQSSTPQKREPSNMKYTYLVQPCTYGFLPGHVQIATFGKNQQVGKQILCPGSLQPSLGLAPLSKLPWAMEVLEGVVIKAIGSVYVYIYIPRTSYRQKKMILIGNIGNSFRWNLETC